MNNYLVQATHISKNYRVKRQSSNLLETFRHLLKPEYSVNNVLEDISLNIKIGENVALLGKNGTGKSTLIKILCGIIQSDSGEVCVLGHNPALRERELYKELGVVFGHKSSLWWDLSLENSLNIVKSMYNIEEERFRRNFDEVVESLSLTSVLSRAVRNLSLGERVKGELAFNLLFEPKVLFLDEPTLGLDISSKYAIRELLHSLKKSRGLSVLLTSHDMKDVEGYSDRIDIIDQGKICFSGSERQLSEEIETPSTIIISFASNEELHSHEKQIKHLIHQYNQISEKISYCIKEYTIDLLVPKTLAGEIFNTLSQNISNEISLRTADLEQIIYNHFTLQEQKGYS